MDRRFAFSLSNELVVRHEFNSDGETDESRNNGMELPVRSGQPLDEAIRLRDEEEVCGDVLRGIFVGAGGRAQHQVSELQAEEVGVVGVAMNQDWWFAVTRIGVLVGSVHSCEG